MIKLIVSLLLSVGMCYAADDGQLPDEQQEFMHTFLSKSQKERQAIIRWLHQALSVDRFQINDDQEIVYNGKAPEDLTLLGDVMYAMLAKQMHFDESLGVCVYRLNEHTRLLSDCNANIVKFLDKMTFFEHKTTQIVTDISARLSHLEAGLNGLEEKVDRLKEFLTTDEQSTS